MDPLILTQIALGTIPPLVAMLAALCVLWRGGGDAGPSAWRRAAVPMLIAAVYIGVHAFLFGWPELPVRSARHTLIATALAGAAAGAIVAWCRTPAGVTFGLGAGAAGAGVWLVMRVAGSSWTVEQQVLWIGASAVAGGLSVVSAESIARRLGGRAGPAAVLIAVGGVAQVLATGFFSLSLGQSAGVGAAALAAGVGASFIRGVRASWGGVTTVPVVMACVCTVQGVVLAGSDRPWLITGLCAACLPLGAMVLRLLPEGWSGVRRTACVLLGIVVPLGAAVAMGAMAWLRAGEGY